MHLEKNILKGKFGKNKELKKEAREEMREDKFKSNLFAKKYKSTLHQRALEKVKGGRVGSGHSHISNKSYKHD